MSTYDADLVGGAGVDERPDVDGGVEPRTEPESAGPRLEALEQRLDDGALDDDPRRRRAALPGRAERRPQDPVGGEVEVGVGQDDDAVLAAELERDALEAPRRRGRRCACPVADEPGERDDRHVGALDDRVADLAARPGHEVDDAGRETGLGHELDEQRRAMRRVGRRA